MIPLLMVMLCLAQSVESPTAIPAARKASVVCVLPIQGEMDSLTVSGLADRLALAKKAGADAIVLQLDTPGGDLLATLELCHQIKAEYPANTVAWIRPRAYSAGVITALACREIVVAPHGVLGDAAPIAAMPLIGLISLPSAERAKLEAPLLSEVTDSARRSGHDERLARAFVKVDDELWLLEDPQRGERYVVDENEYKMVFEQDPIRTRGSAGSPARNENETPGETQAESPLAAQEFPLVPFRTSSLRQPQANDTSSDAQRDQSMLPTRALLTPADRARLRVVSQIDAADELLTLQADEARSLGLASAVIADETELKNFLGARQVFTISAPWSESLARALTSWWMRTLLVTVLVICFFVEMSSPGLGIFGLTGVACVALLAGGSFLAGLSQWWPTAAILVGLILVAVEILFIQGTMICGALGVLAFAGGVIGLFVVSDPSPESGEKQAFLGLASLATSLVVAGIAAWFLGPRLQKMRPWRSAVLEAAVGSPPIKSSAPIEMPPVGATAIASTSLRPVGKIEFAGSRFDARSEGTWISMGAKVRIIRLEGIEIIVEQTT